MVYDREMGSMRILLTTPLPRWYLLTCKLLAGTGVSIVQVYVFLLIALGFGIDFPPLGFLTVLPALVVSGLMLGAIGLLLSTTIRQLENFAGIMNFVIFPMFFLSSALYPLWKMRESSLFCTRSAPSTFHPCRRADPLRSLRARRAGGARLDLADAGGRDGARDPRL